MGTGEIGSGSFEISTYTARVYKGIYSTAGPKWYTLNGRLYTNIFTIFTHFWFKNCLDKTNKLHKCAVVHD